MHGLGEDGSQKEVLTCPLHTIARVEERRFELRDLALELFFERACNMPPIMIAFRSNKVIFTRASFFNQANSGSKVPSYSILSIQNLSQFHQF